MVHGKADVNQILDDLDCPVELMQAQQARGGQVSTGNSDDLYSYRRGDIPIFNFDDADRILIATLQELIETRRREAVGVLTTDQINNLRS